MFFLAGAAGATAMDLISSLRQGLMGSTGGATTGVTPDSSFTLPNSQASTTSSAAANGPSSSTSTLTPTTMNALLAVQGQQSDGNSLSSQLFSLLDTNGDGSITKSEFEQAFAANGNTSKADALFAKLDTNSDGSISQSELTSGLKGRGHHHHHGMGGMGAMADAGSSSGASSGSSSGSSGTTSKTVTNPDGSTTTTISYADGTSISMTQAASNSGGAANMLERMIQRQAQMFAASSAGQSLAVTA